MEREMNFFDLCVACGRAIGRGLAALWRLVTRMLRLTYRYWWLVITLVLLAAVAAFYYTRKDNQTFKMQAVAFLNGPSIQQFEQAFAPVRTGKMLPDDEPLKALLDDHRIRSFETYRVVDCMHDGVADFVDFKRKSSPTDTFEVQMNDRLCIEFRVKARNMDIVPEAEQALLAFLNSNEAMRQSFATYRKNLEEEVAFNHSQALKLDSLTSSYYFNAPSPARPMSYSGNGVNFYGDRQIKLFLKDIYAQQKHMQQSDYRLQLATAPVTLENHFSVNPKPVNGRLKILLAFLLISWIGSCLLAEIIDRRKDICAWLKA